MRHSLLPTCAVSDPAIARLTKAAEDAAQLLSRERASLRASERDRATFEAMARKLFQEKEALLQEKGPSR